MIEILQPGPQSGNSPAPWICPTTHIPALTDRPVALVLRALEHWNSGWARGPDATARKKGAKPMDDELTTSDITLEVEGDLRVVTLNRPEDMNASTTEMLFAFPGLLEKLAT